MRSARPNTRWLVASYNSASAAWSPVAARCSIRLQSGCPEGGSGFSELTAIMAMLTTLALAEATWRRPPPDIGRARVHLSLTRLLGSAVVRTLHYAGCGQLDFIRTQRHGPQK